MEKPAVVFLRNEGSPQGVEPLDRARVEGEGGRENPMPLKPAMFKVGQRVIVHQPVFASPVAMAPAVSVSGTIKGRYLGDYLVKLDGAEGGIDTVVVPGSRLDRMEEQAG
jgi:hypothetical protein